MRTSLVAAITMVLAAVSLRAERLANGLELVTPAGWTIRSNPQVALLVPPDMATEPNGKDPSELYVVAVLPAMNGPEDPQLVSILRNQGLLSNLQVRASVAPQAFVATGGQGYLHRFETVSEGASMRLDVYVVGLQGGGAAALLAMGRPAMVARRAATIGAVAAGLYLQAGAASAPAAPTAASSGAVAQWEQRLRGHKLYKFSGYSSSYGSGGYNSQSTLFLAPNGNYEFRRSGSVSVYVDGASGGSASRSGSQGRWRISEQGNRVVLELVSNTGTETITLTADGSKTLLNGQRWLVGN